MKTHRMTCFSLASMALVAGQAVGQVSHKTVEDGQKRTVSTWAAKGMIKNPVSFCLDWSGNMYVAESDRAGNAVADTRGLGHLNAVEEDLQFKSVEDRRAQIHKWIEKGAFPKDFFTRTEDRVRIVRDTDGDGAADWQQVFAGGFNGELDGIGAGVLWLNGSLYYTCIPDLWLLSTAKDKPYEASERKSLSHGYGVRWCFYGHDLHGLTQGPDGRIYFSMGDRGFNVHTAEGKDLVGPDRGGVFRCWPDGSELELFYQGLRNPQELAFDELGDLFTGDNNCDSGDRARVVHIVEGGDSGWRQDVQSLDSRGPWNREGMWKTLKEVSGIARPAWSLPPVEYLGAGPSGMALYPGTGESDKYNGCLFMVDFYGSGATVHAFRCAPDGAFFKFQDHVDYYKGSTVTDIAWSYDGRLLMTDWGGGWEPNPNGNVLAVKNETVHGDTKEAAAIAEVKGLFATGFAGLPEHDLVKLFAHRDQRVRLAAQHELATRDVRDVAWLAAIPHSEAHPLIARIHAVWCLGEMARRNPAVCQALESSLEIADAELLNQVVRTVGDQREVSAETIKKFYDLTKHPSARARLSACIAIAKHPGAIPGVGTLLNVLDENENKDLTLRHGATYALSKTGNAQRLVTALAEPGPGNKPHSAAARLGVVMALRLMKSEAAAGFLDDADPLVAVEAARAVYDLRLMDGMPRLAAMLNKPVPADRAVEPLMRRAIEANVMLGTAECAGRLAALAGRAEVAAEWKSLAIDRLMGWDVPLKREGVWGNWADYPARPASDAAAAVRASIGKILEASQGSRELTNKARHLEARFALGVPELRARVNDKKASEESRAAALEELAKADAASMEKVCESVLDSDGGGELRAKAMEIYAKTSPKKAVTRMVAATTSGTAAEKQQAVRLLGSSKIGPAGTALKEMAGKLKAHRLDDAIALEVYEACMARPEGDEARQLAAPAGVFPGRPDGYSNTLLRAGGNPAAGKEIFLHHGGAECLRCHTIDGLGVTGGTAGPNLSTIGARQTMPQLLQSLLEPAAVVAQGYGTVSAMPVMSQHLKPAQTRDVAAFLATLKPSSHAAAESQQRTAVEAEGSRAPVLILILCLGGLGYALWPAMTKRSA